MTFTARLSERQTTVLAVVTFFVAAFACIAAFSSITTLGRIATWCENLLQTRPIEFSAVVVVCIATMCAASLCMTAWALGREFFSARALCKEISRNTMPMPSRVAAALLAVNALEMPTIVVADPRRFAYTFGAFHSRVVLSTGLISALSLEELKTVIRHERHHFRARDPLRSFFWEMICHAFFFLPLLRNIVDHLTLVRELKADARAMASDGGRRALASALLKTASFAPFSSTSTALTTFGHLRCRIEAFSEQKRSASITYGLPRTIISGATLITLLYATALPASAQTNRDTATVCREAFTREVQEVLWSPRLIGPSSTETDLQSREIIP